MKQHSQQFLKKRKFLMVLPLLVLPFTTLAFWSMGGGKGKAEIKVADGLNTELPGARLSNSGTDKLSLYKKEAADSAKAKFSNPSAFWGDEASGADSIGLPYNAYDAPGYSYRAGSRYGDPNEDRVHRRLNDLDYMLRQQDDPAGYYSRRKGGYEEEALSPASLDRLERMMNSMTESDGEDPEIQQLSGMLDRIIDIQHPERIRERSRQQSLENRGSVYGVNKLPENTAIPVFSAENIRTDSINPTLIGGRAPVTFFGLSSVSITDTLDMPAIPAIVPETQTLVSGAALKMQLGEDIYVAGNLIPRGTDIYGKCNLSGERLEVEITGVRYRNMLFPVNLAVYGLDAMEGIRIPGAITREAAKDGADRALGGMQFMSLDPSIGAQAAGAGIEAARGLLSKKIKLVRFTINAGLNVLLMDKTKRRN